MKHMFSHALSFTGTGLSSWNIQAVVDMTRIFESSALSHDEVTVKRLQDAWDLAGVQNTAKMFMT